MEQIKPFYVGQEVEAIRDHSRSFFKKGMRFTVTSVMKSHCGYVITTGLPIPNNFDPIKMRCICGLVVEWNGKECPFSSGSFRAITPNFESISFTQVVEENLVSVN